MTVMSRDVAHDTIVDEIIAALAGRSASRRSAPAEAAPDDRAAALREPTIVERRARRARLRHRDRPRRCSASLGARIAALQARRAAAIVTDETVARRTISAAVEAALAAAGIAHDARSSCRPAKASKSLRHGASASATRCSTRQDRAQRPRGRARRRRGRRSRRLRRRDRAARPRLRAGADHAAGAGRFLGRRQDRRSIRATARTWSARSTSRSW